MVVVVLIFVVVVAAAAAAAGGLVWLTSGVDGDGSGGETTINKIGTSQKKLGRFCSGISCRRT